MKQQRMPITYFEKIGKILTGFLPSFFNKKHTYSEVSQATQLGDVKRKKDVGLLESKKEFIEYFELPMVSDTLSLLNDVPYKTSQDKKNFQYMSSMGANMDASKALDSQKQQVLDAIWYFRNGGSKIFRVEEDLFNELILTDCKKIDAEFLLLPYQSVLFHIPYNTSLLIREKIVKWFHVMDTELDMGETLYEFLFISEDNTLTVFDFILGEGDIYSQILKTLESKQWDGNKAKKEVGEFMSFFASLILYINSDEPDKTHIAPAVIFKDKDSKLPVCSLGGKIKINNSLKTIYVNSEEPHKKSIHILKWTVRGHFRKQPCGKNRSENKIIWIRPYIKGKERESQDVDFKPTVYELI